MKELISASGRAVLHGNAAFSILVLPTEKRSNFLKEVFVCQKICFKVKVSKIFKISSADLSNGGLF